MPCLLDKFHRLGVEALGMPLEHARSIDGERAIHKDRYWRHIVSRHHDIQVVNKFLRSPDRKCRDDNLAPALDRSYDDILKFLERSDRIEMRLISVGGFH